MHGKRLIALLAGAAIAVLGIAPSSASATHEDATPIHPGVMTFTEGAQCTSNFIFRDGSSTYIGQAAHCSGTGAATETNGCEAESLPIGTPVEVDGASQPGTLAYNSWITMQANGETDEETCAFNDFALVRLNPADVPKVDPSVPALGGPTGMGTWGAPGSTVYTYGNSSLRLGASALSPKQGTVVQNSPGGWSHDVYTLTPGVPGDSGSGFLNASGGAIGTLSTVQLAPLAGSNGVGDLPKELAYAKANGFAGVNLVPGTDPWNPNIVNAVLRGLGIKL
jgi:hypothetical protein